MNKNPEQIARDNIDKQLIASGWIIQDFKKKNVSESLGVAIREYQTNTGPADYALFVNSKPVGIIEAKREEEGQNLTVHEDQSEGYALAKLKYLDNEKLPFVYESTGKLTHFTDFRDPKPRSRLVFSFHRPETFQNWLSNNNKSKSLRGSLLDLNQLPEEGLRDCQINAIANCWRMLKLVYFYILVINDFCVDEFNEY